MIITETVTIKGREFSRTYSDAGKMIERNGAMYVEAIDPVNSGRVYTETELDIPNVELAAEEALAELVEALK